MKKIYLLLISVILLFFACEEKGLHVKVRFDQTAGLQADNRVIFESNRIGRVSRVFYSQEAIYEVDLQIKADFANAVTENARFYIIDDPLASEKKAIEMIQIRKGGSPLADGTIVDGSTRSLAVYQKMLENFDKQAGKLAGQFQQFLEDVGKLPESEAVQQLHKDLADIAREMEKAGKATRDKIQNEIVPMLKQELEQLKKRLEKYGREKEVEPLQEQLEKLTII